MRVSSSTTQLLWRGWLLALAVAIGLSVTLAGSAAWRAMAAHRSQPTPTAMLAGYDIDDHFPGAALLYLDAPPITPGATDTVALPPLPVSLATAAALTAGESGIVPARPFALVGTPLDRSRAMQCLADAIYYEAASEPDAGQRAVAQVVLNRVRHPAFPATVCGVVYQGSERGGCQFSFACDGAMARVPSRSGWARAANVAAAALAGYVYTPVGLATHYHTYAVTPAWNRTLVMTDAVGAHLFHRWKGYWGTASAFSQVYRGDEPLPGPHARLAVPVPPITMASATTSPPVTPSTTILPAWQGASTAAVPAPTTDTLPPASQILDKWKDSGKPL